MLMIADDCMDAGARAPKVGALGDAGAVAESNALSSVAFPIGRFCKQIGHN
ncbi:MAG: hypothetical protein PSV18_01290 [Methylobacter sp.]|uniref:Uncharacterized protein n=1 Tax=Candidatus Methylobacter titanis TaxID=3053457 RepID=A0AA43Q1J2_9GAMM|nr:hypothetical protein [Candidatus Methylobacter titanis]MDI1291363.1 hypothetical protein [Candidatus Methylobacter titanis]